MEKLYTCLAFQQGFLKQKQLMKSAGFLWVDFHVATEDLEWPENEETSKNLEGWNGEPLIGLSFDLGFL